MLRLGDAVSPAELASSSLARFWLRSVTVGALVTAGIAAGWLLRNSHRHGSLPVLKVSVRHLDLGEGKPKQRMKGRLTIANAGREPLQFAIQPSCGCTSLEPRDGTLSAGRSQEIDVAVELPENTGTQRSVQVLIQSNDPKNPTLVCSVAASCPSPFTISPGYVAFGNVTTEEITGTQQTITVRDRQGKSIADPTAIEFECGSEHVLVDRDPDSPHDCRLRVHLASSLPRGDTNAILFIRPTGANVASEMPVQVTHIEPFVVAPPVIILGTGKTEQDQEVHTVFVWRNGSNTGLGRLLSIEAPKGISVTENVISDSRRRRLDVAVARSSGDSPGGQVRLAYEHIKEALIVNVAPSRP